MKSETDKHWNERAIAEKNSVAVNIADVSQRELETKFLLDQLNKNDTVLEVGCGNGFLTNILRDHANHIDAFDYAENMVAQAKAEHGETNNKFFHDNLLAPSNWGSEYDVVVCVRVLINLRDFDEMKIAVDNMKKSLKVGGRLLLIEGYTDGFDALNALRKASGLESFSGASINYYCGLSQMKEYLAKDFDISAEFHTGAFDFLTRVVYPALVGSNKATEHGDFHERILPIVKNFNPQALEPLARLRGFSLVKHA